MLNAKIFLLPEGTELILASHSPRRQDFLKALGLPFRVLTGDGEEPKPEICDTPEECTLRAARFKAHAAAAHCDLPAEKSVIIAADTVVEIDGMILGKPKDTKDALRMLSLLAGRCHSVTTSVAVWGSSPFSFTDKAQVTFHPWPKAVLSAYVASNEPMDKAGAYAVQGLGSFLIHSIQGSWTTVVGLPLGRLVGELVQRGLLVANSA